MSKVFYFSIGALIFAGYASTFNANGETNMRAPVHGEASNDRTEEQAIPLPENLPTLSCAGAHSERERLLLCGDPDPIKYKLWLTSEQKIENLEKSDRIQLLKKTLEDLRKKHESIIDLQQKLAASQSAAKVIELSKESLKWNAASDNCLSKSEGFLLQSIVCIRSLYDERFNRLTSLIDQPLKRKIAFKPKELCGSKGIGSGRRNQIFPPKLPLQIAARNGDLREVKRILAMGPSALDTPKNGTPAIFYAAESNRTNIVEALLGAGVNVNSENLLYGTPLHIAAESGAIESLLKFIEWGAFLNAVNSMGQTPLHLAAREKHGEIACLLLASGADINAKTTTGASPLIYAVESNAINIVNLLLEKGANLESNDQYLGTAVEIAARNGRADMVAQLLKKSQNDPLVNEALAKGEAERKIYEVAAAADLEKVKNYLIIKPDLVNSVKNGRSLIQYAISSGDIKLLKFLIEKGAILKNLNEVGESNLNVAIRYSKNNVVQFLLDSGEYINDTHRQTKESSLHLATKMKNKEIINLLLRKGANLEDVSWPLETVLLAAIKNQDLDTVKLYLENKADPNNSPNGHTSPLHLAAQLGNMNIVKLLLQYGANTNALAYDNKTPAQWAIKYNHKDISDLINVGKPSIAEPARIE